MYNPANVYNPSTEWRIKKNTDGTYNAYFLEPTNIQSDTAGSYAKGGNITKSLTNLTYNQLREQGIDPNTTYSMIGTPEEYTANARYSSEDIKKGVTQAFQEFDPNNTTGWTDKLNDLVTQAQTLYSQDPTRQDKIFGDVWNTFRYKPEQAGAIQTIQEQNAAAQNEAAKAGTTGTTTTGSTGTTGGSSLADAQNLYKSLGMETMGLGDKFTGTPEQISALQNATGGKFSYNPQAQQTTSTTGNVTMTKDGQTMNVPASAASAWTAQGWTQSGEGYAVNTKPAEQKAPEVAANTYVVKTGDTLSKIAAQYGMTWQELAKLNPQIVNPNLIYPGENIITGGAVGTGGAKTGGTGETGGYTGETTENPQLSALQRFLNGETAGTTGTSSLDTLLQTYLNKLNAASTTSTTSDSTIANRMKQAGDLTNQIDALPEEIRTRVQDFVVNAAQLGRITTKEVAPLQKLLNTLNENISILKEQRTEDRQAAQDAKDDAQTAFTNVLNLLKMKADEKQNETQNLKDWLDLQIKQKSLSTPDTQVVSVNGHDILINKTTGETIKDLGYSSSSSGSTQSKEYFTEPDSKGVIHYYFGYPKNKAGATELSREAYIQGKSIASGQTTTEVPSVSSVSKDVTQYKNAGWTRQEVEAQMKKDLGATELPSVFQQALDNIYPENKTSWIDKVPTFSDIGNLFK